MISCKWFYDDDGDVRMYDVRGSVQETWRFPSFSYLNISMSISYLSIYLIYIYIYLTHNISILFRGLSFPSSFPLSLLYNFVPFSLFLILWLPSTSLIVSHRKKKEGKKGGWDGKNNIVYIVYNSSITWIAWITMQWWWFQRKATERKRIWWREPLLLFIINEHTRFLLTLSHFSPSLSLLTTVVFPQTILDSCVQQNMMTWVKWILELELEKERRSWERRLKMLEGKNRWTTYKSTHESSTARGGIPSSSFLPHSLHLLSFIIHYSLIILFPSFLFHSLFLRSSSSTLLRTWFDIISRKRRNSSSFSLARNIHSEDFCLIHQWLREDERTFKNWKREEEHHQRGREG